MARDAYEQVRTGKGLWSTPRAVVVDEAHALEEALREANALPITRPAVRRMLQAAARQLQAAPHPQPRVLGDRLEQAADALDAALRETLRRSEQAADRLDLQGSLQALPIHAGPTLQQALTDLLRLRSPVEEALTVVGAGDNAEEADLVWDALHHLRAWLTAPETAPYVTWRKGATLYVGDLDLTPALQTLTNQTAVFTSGTLGMRDDFRLFERALGIAALPARRVLRFYAPSPFDYPRQLRYQLLTDLPDPRQTRPEQLAARAAAVAQALRAVQAQHPRVLALFTSKRLLQAMQTRLTPECPVIADGQASVAELAEQFRKASAAIYLSTAAWEGLDAPGPKAVVIVQLPYPVPTDPWLDARRRRAALSQRDVMAHLIEPTMQLRMLQGVGRAIRRQEDTGVVVCLDPRAVPRWQASLASVLPPGRVEDLKTQDLAEGPGCSRRR